MLTRKDKATRRIKLWHSTTNKQLSGGIRTTGNHGWWHNREEESLFYFILTLNLLINVSLEKAWQKDVYSKPSIPTLVSFQWELSNKGPKLILTITKPSSKMVIVLEKPLSRQEGLGGKKISHRLRKTHQASQLPTIPIKPFIDLHVLFVSRGSHVISRISAVRFQSHFLSK